MSSTWQQLAADSALVKFWATAPALSGDRLLTFAAPFLKEQLSFYGRMCYAELASILLTSQGRRRFFLEGNSGIGKSSFGMLFVHYLKAKNLPVVYIAADRPAYLFLPDGNSVYEGTWEHTLRKVTQTGHATTFHSVHLWVIADGVEPISLPTQFAGKVLVIASSTQAGAWDAFIKDQNYTLLFMSPWSQDEMAACRIQCFPAVGADGVRRRFDRWGGIPRYVFEQIDPQRQARLDDAITEVGSKPEQYLDSFARPSSDTDIRGRILHKQSFDTAFPEIPTADVLKLDEVKAQNTYDSYTFQFASPFVQQQLEQAWHHRDCEQLIAFLAVRASVFIHGKFAGPGTCAHAVCGTRHVCTRGLFFEPVMHTTLSSKCAVKMRELKEKDPLRKGDIDTKDEDEDEDDRELDSFLVDFDRVPFYLYDVGDEADQKCVDLKCEQYLRLKKPIEKGGGGGVDGFRLVHKKFGVVRIRQLRCLFEMQSTYRVFADTHRCFSSASRSLLAVLLTECMWT